MLAESFRQFISATLFLAWRNAHAGQPVKKVIV
jgi:hypothetical protein